MPFLKIKTPLKTWPLPTENHHHSSWQYVSPDPTPICNKRNEGNIRLCICNHLYMIVFCSLFQKLAPSFTAISSWPCPHRCGRGVAEQPCWQFSALLGPCPVERCWEGSYLPCQRVVLMGRVQERIGRWGWVKIWGQHIDDELDQCAIITISNFCAYIYTYIIIYITYINTS